MRFPVFVLIAFCVSCFPVPRKYKQAFGCFSGTYTGLDTLINIHGFYRKMVIDDKRGLYTWGENGKLVPMRIDTSYSNFLFFKDGIFIRNIAASDDLIGEYLIKKAMNKEHVWGFSQGIYTIHGDTLKTKVMGYGRPNNHWYGNEVWYKIIDQNTIVDFYSKQLVVSGEDKKKEEFKPQTYFDATPYQFVYVERMPESHSWLKEEKWFYCNSK